MNDGHRLIFLASDYDSIQLDDITYVQYLEPILEHNVLICHAPPNTKSCFCVNLLCLEQFESLVVWSSCII